MTGLISQYYEHMVQSDYYSLLVDLNDEAFQLIQIKSVHILDRGM